MTDESNITSSGVSLLTLRPMSYSPSAVNEFPTSDQFNTERRVNRCPQPNGREMLSDRSRERSGNLVFPEPMDSDTLLESPRASRCCSEPLADVCRDYRNFYSTETLLPLGVIFAGGAILANTQGDREIAEIYRSTVHRPDELTRISKVFYNAGDGYLVVPILLASAFAGNLFPNWEQAEVIDVWGERSFRAILVGAPVVVAAQYLTGGSRPIDSNQDSRWKPLRDKNGVSGHAFMGAVPFLTAAHMTDDILLKSGLYFGSTLTAWSRVQDDKHYLSQVILGWSVAYFSTQAVWQTDTHSFETVVTPAVFNDGVGILIDVRY